MNIFSIFNFNKIKQNKNNLIVLVILLSWVHQWLTIGSFINIEYGKFQFDSILQYRNQSLAIFVINIIIFFFNREKKIKNNILLYLYLIPVTYLLGLTNRLVDNYGEKDIYFFYYLTFIMQMINTLLILNNFSKIRKINENFLLRINLLLIFTYIIVIIITQNFQLRVTYNLDFADVKILTNANGFSRMLFIINIYLACHYFMKKKNIMILFIYFIINCLIIALESRQALLLISVQLLLIIFYNIRKKNLIKTMFKYYLFLVIVPLCFSFVIKNTTNNRLFLLQGELRHDNLIYGFTDPRKENFSKENNLNETKDNFDKLNKISTGRLEKWIFVITHIINSKMKNILIGNGPEFDREIIRATGNDVANGLIYLLLCGGLLALFSFFIIIKKYLKIVLKTFSYKKDLSKDVFFCFSIICIISLSLRSLVENSFFVYGVDFLLISSCFFYVVKKIRTRLNSV